MQWFESFLTNLGAITGSLFLFFIIAIIATALWGDASMIVLIVTAMHFNFPLWIIMIAGYIGSMIGDVIWFVLGMKFLKRVEKHEKFGKGYNKLVAVINKISHKNPLVTLSIVKFLYGTRVITIIYLVKKKLKLRKFIEYNALALILWVFFMTAVGYLVGLGFAFVANVVKNIELAITLLIVLFILFNLLQRRINEWLEIE